MSALPGPLPAPVPNEAARRVADDLRRRLAVLRAAAGRVRRREDIEAIHDLRVAARRLAAGLQLWDLLLAPRPRRRALRSVRRLRQRIGVVREREVLLAHLRERAQSAPPAARVALTSPLARLERRVERGRERAADRAGRARIARLAERVERALEDLPALAAAHPAALDEARRQAADRRLRALGMLAEGLAARTDESLHQARIAVKKWRYAEEGLRAAAPDHAGGDLRQLRGLQETLGEIHDAAVLRDRLARESERAARRGLVADAAALHGLAESVEIERRQAVEALAALAAALVPRGD
jgi:CHAD domain-containing protein